MIEYINNGMPRIKPEKRHGSFIIIPSLNIAIEVSRD